MSSSSSSSSFAGQSSFPFHLYLPEKKDEKPFFIPLVEKLFKENVLFLSQNCISTRVSMQEILKAFKKKFLQKITREQFLLAFESLKQEKVIPSEITFDTEDYFYGIELLHFKPFVFKKKNEKCKKCGLYQDLNENGHCVYCRADLTIRKKRKEHQVRDFLIEKGWKLFSSDRVVDNDCGKERPDILIDMESFFVCVEVDENQHKAYNLDCEIPRMINIFHAIGMSKMIFVRFNPDSFVDKYYKKNKLDITSRCEILHDFLFFLQENKTKSYFIESLKTLTEYRLFFDYDPSENYSFSNFNLNRKDCFLSEKVLVHGEILDYLNYLNFKN